MIEIIPAIDIIDGKCVRLSQGDYSKKNEYEASPLVMAKKYEGAGVSRVHLVDLDGAKNGEPCNLKTLREIAGNTSLDIEWGGGVKSRRHLDEVLAAGADHVIIGSLAVKQPELMEEWLKEFGGDRIILGADLRDGKVSVSGWLEDSEVSIDEIITRFIPFGLKEAIVTDISKDGMLQGPNVQLYTDLSSRYPEVVFTVSGGVSKMEDIAELDRLGLPRVIVGKAIYEGNIPIESIASFNELR